MVTVPTSVQHLARPLRPAPDSVVECRQYCEELKAEIWRLDRRWAQLKADALSADISGYGIDTVAFMRRLEQ